MEERERERERSLFFVVAQKSRSFSSEEKVCCCFIQSAKYYLVAQYQCIEIVSLLLSSMCYIVVIVSVLLFNGHLGERRGGIHGFGHRFSVWSLALRDAFFTLPFPPSGFKHISNQFLASLVLFFTSEGTEHNATAFPSFVANSAHDKPFAATDCAHSPNTFASKPSPRLATKVFALGGGFAAHDGELLDGFSGCFSGSFFLFHPSIAYFLGRSTLSNFLEKRTASFSPRRRWNLSTKSSCAGELG